ncbi:MAG: monovalent cation/H(+) antiporter subunit G [Bacillota bacterium]|nr:monovalent cation/H(+) antiporter subunit G [Bacillota bacterium]
MKSLIEIITSALVLIGAFFTLAGSIGVVRLPDIYNRLHAASKSSTLGVSSIVLGSLLYFGAYTGVYSGKQILTIVFIFITAPVGAQMISRAAYKVGVKLWDKSVCDRMEGCQKINPKGERDF